MADAEEQPQPHEGWRRWHFRHLDRSWYLITIERDSSDGGPRSQIGALDENRQGWWDHWHAVSLEGSTISVDAAVRIISGVHTAWERGIKRGDAQARADVRRALGIAQ